MNEGEVYTLEEVTANSNSFSNKYNKDIIFSEKWKYINWKTVNQTVNRTQTRIAKATINGNWQLVRELQRMLVNSHHAKLLAVREVTTNYNHALAGVDGILWESLSDKMKAVLELNKGKYKSKPLKRVEIKENKNYVSKKLMEIPTMYDRAMQFLYMLALDPVAESKADENSYGFRMYRSSKDAKEQIYKCMDTYNKAQWVLNATIKGFFHDINNKWLLRNILMDKEILKEFLKSEVVIKGNLYGKKKRVPHEGLVYPLLVNMTLDGLENVLKNRYWKYDSYGIYRENLKPNYKQNIKKVNLIRYGNNFIVTGDSKNTCEEIKHILSQFLKERGLIFSESETKILHIDEGFNFLNWYFKKYNGKLLIKPSKQSISKFLEEIRIIIKNNAQTKQKDLILQLNRKIKVWRNYHKHVIARDAFEMCDNAIFQALWKWALRRHKNKGKMWIKDKYWHKIENNNWVFYDNSQILTKENQKLIKLAHEKITRYIKINSYKNPYIDYSYFANRNFKLGIRNITGNFKDIWRNQKGICPICGKFLEISDNYNEKIHHIVSKVWGDNDYVNTIVYIHKQCR